MKKISRIAKTIFKDEQGYGTVELLLLVGGIGLLATTIFSTLQTNLAGDDSSSAASKATNKINGLIDNWMN